MHSTDPIREPYYKIRANLHPNYLPGTEGTLQARTLNDASLSVEQVCACLLNRGGFEGDYDKLVDNAKQYLSEAAYLLCNGRGINTGYFTIYPNIGGVFTNAHDTFDKERHPISFRFRTLAKLRRLIDLITVSIEGVVDAAGWIDEYLDTDMDESNSVFTPGNPFIVQGIKIKLVGSHPKVGFRFVPVDNPAQAVNVTKIIENNPSKIIGIAPQTGYQRNRIEICTQYAGSTTVLLKEPRVITSNFILEEV